MRIKRSAGTPIRVNGIPTGFIAGGGWSGCTKKLDGTVARAARLLARTYRCEVEIRFNSDRRSGGAWLRDALEGPDHNCQLGIRAGYIERKPAAIQQRDWDVLPYAERERRTIHRFFLASSARGYVLENADLAREGRAIDCPYSSRRHKSVESALTWLVRHVDRSKLKRLRQSGRAART